MTLADAVLAVLLSLQPHVSDLDEAPGARKARLGAIAQDIATASKGNRDRAAALIVLGSRESHFASWVGDGCQGDPPKGSGDCDKGRARSYWQVWARGCRKGWALPVGSRAAQAAFAGCAARLWQAARRRCQSANEDPLVGAYSGYRSVCRWEPAKARARRHRVMLARL